MKFDLEEIISLIPGNIFWKDKEGKYLGCNDNQAKALKLKSRHDIVGRTLFDLLPEHLALQVSKNDEYVMKTGKEFIVEELGIDKDGNQVMYLSRKIPLFDEHGEVVGLLGIGVITNKTVDIEKIIAFVPGNVFWKDKDGKYLGCNNNVAKILKLESRFDIIGKSDFDLFPKASASLLRETDLHVMESGKEYVVEEQGHDISGKSATYLSRKIPLSDEHGNLSGLLGISMDITFRKKNEDELRELKERAEAANKAKSEFIMNMSHDLRTPMTGIIGFTDILKYKETDPEKKEMLELLEASANRLLSLLNEIVNIAELDEKRDVSNETFSIRNLIDDNFQLLRPALEHKKLNYAVVIDETLPYSVHGDRKRLSQILLNLTGNAVKFTEKGQVKVTVKTLSPIKKGNIKIQLIIQDTGIGIESQHFQKIFEKFSSLNSRNKEKYPGSGLGLWLVKKFVDDLGGKISVDSKVDVGTTFTLDLSFKVMQKSL